MKRQIRLRARSTDGRSSSAVQYPFRDDAASLSLENQTPSLPPSSASIRKTKIRARPDATNLRLGRRRWWTSSGKCLGKQRKEFAPRQSRSPEAASFPPFPSSPAVCKQHQQPPCPSPR